MCRVRGRVNCRRPQRPIPSQSISTLHGVAPLPPPSQPLEPQFQIPLQSTKVEVQIVDFVATTTITQHYKNTETDPLEAQYQFFLEDKQTVTDFAAVIDGKTIKGVIQEKELFIKITYVHELEFDYEGRLVFTIPSESEKYSKLNASSANSSALSALQLEINLRMTSFIKQVSSPTHPITFEFGDEPTQAKVTLSSTNEITKDFILQTKLAKPHTPVGTIQKDSKGRYALMAALYPEFKQADDEEIYTEMIFLIDRSGSMAGSSLEQVRATLLIFLRSLSEGTKFNLVGFGSRPEFLFKAGSVQYNDESLEKATAYVKNMKADLGGTNILEPLKVILQQTMLKGYPRQVFLLTDGEVNNTQQCIDYVKQHADTTRVFTFGVGKEASQALVKGVARAGEGEYEFCLPGQSMDAKVLKQLNRAMLPSLTNVKLSIRSEDDSKLQASKFKQAPFHFPPLFSGKRVIAYALLPEEPKKDITVTFTGDVSGAKQSQYKSELKISCTAIQNGDLMTQLAAKKLIQDLEDHRSRHHLSQGVLKQGVTQDDIKAEIKSTSIEYNVLSKETAFVAVEERDEATEGSATLRKFGISVTKLEDQPKSTPQSPTSSSSLLRLGGRGGAVPTSSISPISSSSSAAAPRSSTSYVPAPQREQQEQRQSQSSRSRADGAGVEKRKKGGGSPIQALASKMAAPSGGKGFGFASSNSAAGPPPPLAPLMKSNRSSSISNSNDLDSEDSFKAVEECKSDKASFKKKKSKDRKSSKEKEEKMELAPPRAPQSAPSRRQESAPLLMDEEGQGKEEGVPQQMRNLIMKQKASGEWRVEDVEGMLGGIDEEKIQSEWERVKGKSDMSDDELSLWTTAVVLSWLKQKFSGHSDSWSQVVKKGARFVAKQKKVCNVESIDVLAEAEKFVSKYV